MNRRLVRTALGAAATLSTLLFGAGAAHADTGTFSNGTSITIPMVGQGFPYPSDITVAGLNGLVTDVNATLVSFDHPNPDDLEVLLVAPGGQTTMLMGDAGGNVASVNDTFTLDDSAPFVLPDSGGIVSGISYRPADYEMPGQEPFNAPAPAPPFGLTLSNLNGSGPNGTWSLYTFDDFAGFGGGDFSGGWSLTVTSEVPPTPANPAVPSAGTPGVKRRTRRCKKKPSKNSASAAKRKKCRRKKK